MFETTLRHQIPPSSFLETFTGCIREFADNANDDVHQPAKRERLVASLADLLALVSSADPNDPRLSALYELSEALRMRGNKAKVREFGLCLKQKQILANVGLNAPPPPPTSTLDELVLAGVEELIKLSESERRQSREFDQGKQELEKQLEAERAQRAEVEGQIGAEQGELENLRRENKELGERIDYLSLFVSGENNAEAPKEKPEPEEKPEKIDTQRRFKTDCEGVTYRNRADGSVKFSVLNNERKWEPIDGDYDAAVERRVEILEEREAVSA